MKRRLSRAAHTSQPWRVHKLAPDFEIENVWRVRTPGAGVDDFLPALKVILRTGGKPTGEGPVARFLFALRWKLGSWFGWDRPERGLGTWSTPLTELIAEVSEPLVASRESSPFTPVYRMSREAASEMGNATVHGVMHFGWVLGENGDYELRVTVLTKPHGRAGRFYMRLITPFRLLLVWPPMISAWEKRWIERGPITGGRIAAVEPSITAVFTVEPDYVDSFTLATDAVFSPREWLHECFEQGIPRSGRDLIFGHFLSLHTKPDGTPATIAGWQVEAEDARNLTITARGRHLEANLVAETLEEGVRLTTALHYHNRLGRLLWKCLGPVHRRLIPRVLRRGSSTLRSQANTSNSLPHPAQFRKNQVR